MTRINAGIKPSELTDKHLLAEHREIKRIPNCIKSGRYKLHGIPDKFTLGKGHVKFFYNKLHYLKMRYKGLYQECKNRGFNITDFSEAFEGLPPSLNNNWIPTPQAREIVQQRINEKLNK